MSTCVGPFPACVCVCVCRTGAVQLQEPAGRRGLCPAPLRHVAQGEAARAGWDSSFPPAFLLSVHHHHHHQPAHTHTHTHAAAARPPVIEPGRETHGVHSLVSDAHTAAGAAFTPHSSPGFRGFYYCYRERGGGRGGGGAERLAGVWR